MDILNTLKWLIPKAASMCRGLVIVILTILLLMGRFQCR
jgi:hypothetical protein